MSRRARCMGETPPWLRPSARSHARGVLAEKRVLEVCRAPGRPAWLIAARAATREEDGAGIDVVLESDVGQLWLQVKSSVYGKARFLAKAPDPRIAVVVVRPYDPEEKVRDKVYSTLGELRAQQGRARAVSEDTTIRSGAPVP